MKETTRPVIYSLEKDKFSKSAIKVGRSLRKVGPEVLMDQFYKFYEKLEIVTKHQTVECL